MSRVSFASRLRRSTTIGDAELAALEQLFKAEAEQGLDARVDLLREGERTEQVQVLLDGWACHYKLLSAGQRQITMLLVPGDVCNLASLYVPHLDQAVATLTPCTVAALDGSAVRTLAAKYPGVAQALGWLGTVESAGLAEQATRLGRRSANGRVAHLLCELSLRLAGAGQTRVDGYVLPLTQEDMADLLGLTAVHVGRVLQALRAERVITLQERHLTINNWSTLADMAEFRPDYLHLGVL